MVKIELARVRVGKNWKSTTDRLKNNKNDYKNY